MGRDGLAHYWSESGDDIQHARREANRLARFGEQECVQWRDLAGLENDGAACG